MTHKQLVERGCAWLARRASIVFAEFHTFVGEIPDVIGWTHRHSVLIECKATRADFMRDKLKVSRRKPQAMGYKRYYLCPAHIIKACDLPEGWGLLWAEARAVKVIVEAKPFLEFSARDEITFLVSMLRRAQVRIGTRKLTDWLRIENRFEGADGQPPNRIIVTEES